MLQHFEQTAAVCGVGGIGTAGKVFSCLMSSEKNSDGLSSAIVVGAL